MAKYVILHGMYNYVFKINNSDVLFLGKALNH